MPIKLDVENQRFEFGPEWTIAFKYDDNPYYRKSLERLKGEVDGVSQSTRAVDVVGSHLQGGVLLLEAKDFRGHRIANKARMKSGELATEVALKVRDTVAGLVGAIRKGRSEFPPLKGLSRAITVVLWLEDDVQRDPLQAKQRLGFLNQELKKKLAWLEVKTLVLSSRVPNKISHLRVSNLPIT